MLREKRLVVIIRGSASEMTTIPSTLGLFEVPKPTSVKRY
jgi:hypothetical protein